MVAPQRNSITERLAVHHFAGYAGAARPTDKTARACLHGRA